MSTGAVSRRVTWSALLVMAVAALLIGGRQPSGPPTDEQRVRALTSQIRCPTCRGLSAAASDAPAAEAIRDEVTRRVAEGQNDAEIVGYLVGSYGQDIVLKPGTSGAALWVWALPVVFVAVALTGLGLVLGRRMRRRTELSEEDRRLVERARSRQP